MRSLPLIASLAAATLCHASEARDKRGATHPNILVVVLDDLGSDQMSFPPFGWNASPEAPAMPVLAEVAANGVSFRNFWATPECSPSRAAMLTGRFSFRTGVVTAIVDPMLPAVQLHPSEVTLPKLLHHAGYVSGMLGKYHLAGGPENTPPGYGYEAPSSTVGLDFYDGYWDLPPAIDTTLGAQAGIGAFSCGGIGGLGVTGAACFPDGTCLEGLHPLDAMALGGMPLLDSKGALATSCKDAECGAIDFTLENAYYSWPRTITTPLSAHHLGLPQREYLTSFISRRSTEWIETARAAKKPWLAFSTHSAAHTPIQPPPPMLTGPAANGVSCSLAGVEYRQQYKLMVEAVDRSIGNMLVNLGLGSYQGGEFVLGDLAAANTMLVVVNDNGTYGLNVLLPFSPTRSKQTVYESGVRSPCIVAGARVNSPGRWVDDAVSIVDLFGLVADAAGVNWQSVASPERVIDCLPMMPYLENPKQAPIREYQFAMYEQGIFIPGEVGPCIVGTTVVDGLMTSQALCEANGGCWLGGAAQAPFPVQDYCDVIAAAGTSNTVVCDGVAYCTLPPSSKTRCPKGLTQLDPPTLSQYAARTGQWKLVVQVLPECLEPNDCTIRLYHLAEPTPPLQPGIELLDGSPGVWDPTTDTLPPQAHAAYASLKQELVQTLLSERSSPADGNLDGVVDALDLAGLFAEWGAMGFWDANRDGTVNGADITIVLDAWGPVPYSTALVPSCLLAADTALVREYLFDEDLTDSAGSGVDAISLGGIVSDGAYHFSNGTGVQVPLAGADWSDFDIEMRVNVTHSEFVANKIVDMFNRTLDRGLYRWVSGVMFQILPPVGPTSAGHVDIGTPTLIRYARDGATRQLSLWINGTLQWTQLDPKGLAIPPSDGFVTFFSDDSVTNSVENCAGSVAWIRIRSDTAQ